MFKIHEVKELIRIIDESSIDKFCYEKDGEKIKIERNKALVSNDGVKQESVEQKPVAIINKKEETIETQTVIESKQETPVSAQSTAAGHTITSPMVGTFYSKPTPEAEDYVSVGQKVDEKSIVCIVEAMKLFNEIEADIKGEVVEVLVKNGQLVEYGQPLFIIKEL